jgi:hypothetical protein
MWSELESMKIDLNWVDFDVLNDVLKCLSCV